MTTSSSNTTKTVRRKTPASKAGTPLSAGSKRKSAHVLGRGRYEIQLVYQVSETTLPVLIPLRRGYYVDLLIGRIVALKLIGITPAVGDALVYDRIIFDRELQSYIRGSSDGPIEGRGKHGPVSLELYCPFGPRENLGRRGTVPCSLTRTRFRPRPKCLCTDSRV